MQMWYSDEPSLMTCSCTVDCSDDVCDENGTMCHSSKDMCIYSDSDPCSSCSEPARDNSNKCNSCLTGFSFNQYHHCCSATLKNCIDCSPLSGTVCTLCEAGFFLYVDEAGLTSCHGKFYLACDKSCDNCDPSPYCFYCATAITQTGSKCRVDSFGYQISFSSPNIELDFASPLTTDLTKGSFYARTDSNPPIDIPSTQWTLNACKKGAKQCTITTDLTESQIPFIFDMEFIQA